MRRRKISRHFVFFVVLEPSDVILRPAVRVPSPGLVMEIPKNAAIV